MGVFLPEWHSWGRVGVLSALLLASGGGNPLVLVCPRAPLRSGGGSKLYS